MERKTVMAIETGDKIETCFTCDIVNEYVNLANQFTQDLSQALVPAMWLLFMSLVGLWVVIRGIQLVLVQTTIMDFGKEFIFVIIAAVLLSGQGPELINMIYEAALGTMGSAASIALIVGKHAPIATDTTTLGSGMVELVRTAETAIMKIFSLAWRIAAAWSITTPLMVVYALILIVPYFILWVAYFGQVVVSIFRIMMLATLSPYMMLGFGFGWGRDMAKSGMKAMISAFIVLFASTAVIAVLLYALDNLGIDGTTTDDGIRALADITNPKFMLAVAMGWLGTAFMTEATGIANSITGSQFTNQAVATIVAGAATTALALGKSPGAQALTSELQHRAGNFVGNAAYHAGQGAGFVGEGINQGAQSALDRINKTEG